MLEIESSSPLATIQDRGRIGSRNYGVGTAGAMDDLALVVGNLMLGNEEHGAGIEIQVFPFQVRFLEACDFCLTGADCRAQLDGVPLPPWWAVHAQAGQTLRLEYPKYGSRAYLALGGGVDVPIVLGSRSTQLRGEFGGLEGRMLKKGDSIRALLPCANRQLDFGVTPASLALPLDQGGIHAVRVVPASEYVDFTSESLTALWEADWRISPQSNRYGFRLDGKPLIPSRALEMRSHGIVPGVIQVPHSGLPIIQMRDAQPTGGYPKIGTVIEADLWRLGQLPLGGYFRFIQSTYEEGVKALEANQCYLNQVRRSIELMNLRHA